MSRKWIYIISYSVSAILLVLIAIKLYRHFSPSAGTAVSHTISSEVQEDNLDIIFGNDSSKLTVFMFSNYSCGYCKRFFEEVFPELKNRFIENNTIRLVVKLVDKTKEEAMRTALKTAVCVNEYGNFEALHKLLLYDSRVVYSGEFRDMVDDFTDRDYMVGQCILCGEAEHYLDRNTSLFDSLGFTGTPIFIINRNVYVGYRSLSSFKKIIDNEIHSSN